MKTKLTKEQTDFLNKYTKGSWKLNSKTGLVDVEGNFDCSSKRLKDFKGIKFGVVTGDFKCYHNNLTSLVGAPQKVGKGFNCSSNELTSLKGAPQKVLDFNCEYNELTSLKGAPQEVGRHFDCGNNKLTSLVGAPREVGGAFYCSHNDLLTNLEGAPQKVGDDFSCEDNQLTSLVGAPQKVGGGFCCDNNRLRSLVGAPQEVGGSFGCSHNQLTSLEGAPQQEIGWYFDCEDNPIPEKFLKMIWEKMQNGTTYYIALASLKSKLIKSRNKNVKKLISQIKDDELVKGASALNKFGII